MNDLGHIRKFEDATNTTDLDDQVTEDFRRNERGIGISIVRLPVVLIQHGGIDEGHRAGSPVGIFPRFDPQDERQSPL
jgi:hypothetical protein